MDKPPYWQLASWRAALADTSRAAHTVRFWMVEVIAVAVGAVVAVPFYPNGASAFEQAGISSAAVIAATLGLIVVIFLGNWVAFSARNQRDDAGRELERVQERQDWRSLINDITGFIKEGNRAMENYGRPSLVDSMAGLSFMKVWLPRVLETLPDEYHPDFESQGRGIFKGDAVWVEQLDIRLTRLREIVAEIRGRYL